MIVGTLQFVVFTAEPLKKNALEVLNAALPGLSPTAFQDIGSGQSTASSSADGIMINVVVSPNRIDFGFAKASDHPKSIPDPIDVDAVRNSYLPPIASFAEAISSPRLAVIADAFQTMSGMPECVEIFQKIAPEMTLPEGTSEIDIKVNVPRHSRVNPELLMNRLHRWWGFASVLVAVSSAGTSATMNSFVFSSQMDVNTDAGTAIDASQSALLFDEMLAEALTQVFQGPADLAETTL